MRKTNDKIKSGKVQRLLYKKIGSLDVMAIGDTLVLPSPRDLLPILLQSSLDSPTSPENVNYDKSSVPGIRDWTQSNQVIQKTVNIMQNINFDMLIYCRMQNEQSYI